MKLELVKGRLRGALTRGSEFVTIYQKPDGETDSVLEFMEDSKDYHQMMQGRMVWASRGYTTKKVYDLYYINPELLEEA